MSDEYRCNDCGEPFDDSQAEFDDDGMMCPFCGSRNLIEAEEFERMMEEGDE